MDFFDRMKNNIMTKTTNGALCYSTTGNYLVDINFGVSKFRNTFLSLSDPVSPLGRTINSK